MLSTHLQKLGASVILGWIGIFVIITAIAMLLGSCQSVTPPQHPRDVREQHYNVVAIDAICMKMDGDTVELSMFTASGVLLSSNEVLTAAHVTVTPPGADCIWNAKAIQGQAIMIVPSHVDADRDIAIMMPVTGHFDGVQPVTLGAKPELGDTICEVAGSPYHVRRCGEVQMATAGNHEAIDSTMIVEPGNSGSGVYNERGELVGVISQMWHCGNGQICGSNTASIDDAELAKLQGGVK